MTRQDKIKKRIRVPDDHLENSHLRLSINCSWLTMQQLSKPCCTGSRNENYLEVDDDDSSEPAQDQFYETSEKRGQKLM